MVQSSASKVKVAVNLVPVAGEYSWNITVSGKQVFIPFMYRNRPFGTAKVYSSGYKGDIFSIWIKKNSWLIASLSKVVSMVSSELRKLAEVVYNSIRQLDWCY